MDEPCCPYFHGDPRDLPGIIRHVRSAHPEQEGRIRALVYAYAIQLRERWNRAFRGAIQIDFVCVNPEKMGVLKEALESSDIVPLVFSATPDPGDWNRVRVAIEI